MTKACFFCKKEFAPARSDAVYCSPACRNKAFQAKRKTHPGDSRWQRIADPYDRIRQFVADNSGSTDLSRISTAAVEGWHSANPKTEPKPDPMKSEMEKLYKSMTEPVSILDHPDNNDEAAKVVEVHKVEYVDDNDEKNRVTKFIKVEYADDNDEKNRVTKFIKVEVARDGDS